MKTVDKLLTSILAATLVFSVLSVANPMYLVIGPAAYADNNDDKSDSKNANNSDKRGHDDEECIPENDDEDGDETEQETSEEDDSDDADDDIEDSDDEASDDSDDVDDDVEEEVEDDDTNEQDDESEDDGNEAEDDEVDEGSDDSAEDSDESEESEEQADDDNANEEADGQDDEGADEQEDNDADEQEMEDECENESGHDDGEEHDQDEQEEQNDDGQQEHSVSEEEIKEKHKERLHKIVNSVTGTQIHERHLKAEPNSPGDYVPGQVYSLVAAGMAEHDGTSHSFDVDMDIAVWKSNAAIVLMDVIGGNITIEGQTYTIAVGYGIYSINHDMMRVTALVVDEATGEVFKLKLRGEAFGEDTSLPAVAGESVELTFSGNSGPSKNDFDGAELDLYGALTAS